MEDIFSSNSENTIKRKLNVCLGSSFEINTSEDLDFYFDVKKILSWIKENNFKKIGLQFPDELLNNCIKVCASLKEKASSDCLFFILADTSYGSCCVDLVAGEHLNADAIVHFGHSCLNLVEKIPVLYVLEKFPLDLDSVKCEVDKLLTNINQNKLIILYDVAYYYLYDVIVEKFSDIKSVYVSNLFMVNSQIDTKSTDQNTKILFSRVLPNDLRNDNAEDAYSFLYIGCKETFLNPFLFYFNKNKFFHFNPTKAIIIEPIQFSRTNRELMKRYYLIEKARDAKIFGILIGTMSVANYKNAIDHVSKILKQSKRRYYSFLIGKLNCPKLNNFMEVDMYVLVSCNENSLINSKELNKPVITVYELEIAFNCARLWGDEFICDYKQLLEGNEHYIPLKLSEQEYDVSLITGETRLLNFSNKDEIKNTALINRDEALSVIHHSGAGEFLSNRSWTGLEQNLGKTEVTKPIEGKKGIAMGYENESQ